MSLPIFRLRLWTEDHRDGFAEMHADPVVMADLGGPFDRIASDEKFNRYRDAWKRDGISRWVIEDHIGDFLGYVGVMKRGDADHPLGPHHEVGWRLRREAWGRGYATEGARQALDHAWRVLATTEILSYTSADNQRSRSIMEKLGLQRQSARDFTARYPRGDWTGLVWAARKPEA